MSPMRTVTAITLGLDGSHKSVDVEKYLVILAAFKKATKLKVR